MRVNAGETHGLVLVFWFWYLSMRAMVVRRATTAQRVTSPHEVDGKAGQ